MTNNIVLATAIFNAAIARYDNSPKMRNNMSRRQYVAAVSKKWRAMVAA